MSVFGDGDLLADYKESVALGLDSRMPMGKNKGKLIRDYIDEAPYSLNWFVEQGIVTLNKEASDELSYALGNSGEDVADYLDPETGDLPF